MNTAERIAWGLLSFIALIVLLRWLGTPEDQQKLRPPQVPKEKERQSGKSWSIVECRGGLLAIVVAIGPMLVNESEITKKQFLIAKLFDVGTCYSGLSNEGADDCGATNYIWPHPCRPPTF
jgi:hypothetical protein